MMKLTSTDVPHHIVAVKHNVMDMTNVLVIEMEDSVQGQNNPFLKYAKHTFQNRIMFFLI